jgi:hydrogenase nickel incorporation protein HypA/HybF
MHEMGITAEVLRAAIEGAEQVGATRINSVHLTVGELTEIVPDALQFAWETLTPGTLAEGAVLEIDHTPGHSVCMTCENEFDHDRWDRICPKCGSFATKAVSGDELRIDSVDADVPEEDPPASDPKA